MPSTRAGGRVGARVRSQRGVSLVESAVAAALMGIGVVVGLTAWDTASMSASRAVRQAWANCIVRNEADAILSAPWSDAYLVPPPFDTDHTVQAIAVAVSGRVGDEQVVTVRALDPQSRDVLAQVVFLKARALAGGVGMDRTLSDVMLGCPAR